MRNCEIRANRLRELGNFAETFEHGFREAAGKFFRGMGVHCDNVVPELLENLWSDLPRGSICAVDEDLERFLPMHCTFQEGLPVQENSFLVVERAAERRERLPRLGSIFLLTPPQQLLHLLLC